MSNDLVLVTGGSGFVGIHCIAQLLNAGYRVRTTVRSLTREAEIRAMLKRAGLAPETDLLTLVTADLTADKGWAEAVAGCRYVLHVASPFPMKAPKHEDELIRPAREGTLRVLRAARDAGIERLVLTSSFAAVGYGLPPGNFTEADWSDVNGPGMTAYAKSKTLAEQAAWQFIEQEGGTLQLAVVNPVGIFGPALGPDLSTSVVITQQLLNGSLPGMPDIYFGAVDVRDVADLHLRAMTNPAANGQRFLAVAGHFISALDVAETLKAHMGATAAKVPTRKLPNFAVRIVALWDSTARQIVPQLGKRSDATSAKAERVLSWSPRSAEESIIAAGESLLELGLIKGQPAMTSSQATHEKIDV